MVRLALSLILVLTLLAPASGQMILVAKSSGTPPVGYDWSGKLYGHYRFESGALTTDGSGNSNTLTDAGTVTANTTTYKEGAASADFSGTTQHFYRVDGDLSTNFPGKNTGGYQNFLITSWVRFDTAILSQTYLSKYASETDGRSYRLDLVYGTVANFRVALSSDGSSATVYKTLASADSWPDISPNRWYHVCLWHDSTLDLWGFRSYDDVAAAQHNYSAALTTGINNSISPLTVGAQRTTAGVVAGHMAGNVDQILVYGWADGSNPTEIQIQGKCDNIRQGGTP